MTEEDAQFAKKRILIDLISREIDQFAIEQKKHGWTTRALLVALATLFWLFVNEAPFTSANMQVVWFLFFSFTLTIDLISSCSSMLSAQHGNIPKEPRFVLSSIFGVARLSLIVRLILYSILFFISFKLSLYIFPISRILVQILLGLNVATFLIFVIISYGTIPMSKFQKRKMTAFASFLLTALMIISLIGYYVALVNNFSSFRPTDFKVSLILTLLACVFVLMADMPVISPIASSLISIRRDLVLDKINIDWASKQIDIALSGMRVGDLLQENIKEILDYCDIIKNGIKQMTRTYEEIGKLLPADPSAPRKDEFLNNSEVIMALMRSSKGDVDYVDSVQEKLTKSLVKYQGKANLIVSIDKRATKGIEELSSIIGMAQSELNELYTIEKKQISLLEAKIRTT